ncbi:hypothetical protein JCGZ_04151 [Jatropha curcas]|uniref:Uncharacterized protein n=1 Tax=Jatropha curcas TaxID=180498 RepID=A0A067KTK2_JATCU|nr:hypothetical protein JCGZ_04151 [Jatropha curcas]
MGSSSDEDVQVLHDQSGDKYTEDVDSRVGEAREGMRMTEPLDEDAIMMYEESFQLGFRFRLSEPLKSFFNEYHITISQLHRNGLRFLCGIIELARRDGYNVTARMIRELYHFPVRPNEGPLFPSGEEQL